MNPGVLLLNVGSPDAPTVPAVRQYLREFLLDPRVMDLPWPLRFGLVCGIILPRRSPLTAAAYQRVWGPAGSPLLAGSVRLQTALQARVDVPIALAMRYRHPAIADVLRGMAGQGIQRLLVLPLFPQFAQATVGTAVERVRAVTRALALELRLEVVPPFYADPAFLDAWVASTAAFHPADFDHWLFSFHGLPERHVRRADPTGHHCLLKPDCCAAPGPALPTCYRAQAVRMLSAFVQRKGLPADRCSMAFQSRLGGGRWLAPVTAAELARLAGQGVQRLAVLCPSFVTDCLETLEEIGLRGRKTFLEAGGRDLVLIPALNDQPEWVAALVGWIQAWLGGNPPWPSPDTAPAGGISGSSWKNIPGMIYL